MSKKKPKIANIRYDKGDPKKKNTIAEHEGFYLEIWDSKFGWYTVLKAPLCKSVDYPDAEKKNFIHWDILKQVAELSAQGYKIYCNRRIKL